jgi:tRNA threonylcarbamoyladenosine biosynthesis protein TsaE
MKQLTQLVATLDTEDQTREFAQSLAPAAVSQVQHQSGPLVIALHGTLGAGKTSLVRCLLRAVGITGAIKSPTYALLEPYEQSGVHFHHFDFYRFRHPEEFIERGFDEYFSSHAICLVEWPEKAGTCLPPIDLSCTLAFPPDNTDQGTVRHLTVRAHTANGISCLNAIARPSFLQAAAA